MSSGFEEHRRSYRRATRRAASAAAGIVAVALTLPLLGGLVYYGLDLTRVDLGILCAIDRQLADGAGLWLSPYLGNGAAFFARPEVGLLYPPRWLAIVLPPGLGASIVAVLHLSGAAAATTWLARTFRVRPKVAAGAGLCFALSGTALDLILHSHYVVAAVWLPLSWAASRRFLSPRGRPIHVLVIGGALGLCLLGGEPQAFVIASTLACVETARVLFRRRRAAALDAARVGLAILGAFALGMLQWAPTLAEMAITARSSALAQSEAMQWSFEPALWPAVLWPGWLTEPVQPGVNLWAMWLDNPTDRFPWNRQPYLGSLFIACMVCGVWLRRARLPAIVALVGITLAVGDLLPLLPLLTKLVPPLGMFRYPAKYLVVATLAATMVVALFAETVARSPTARRRLYVAGGSLFLLQLGILAAVATAGDALDRIAFGIDTGLDLAVDLPHLGEMIREAILQSMAPLAAALILVLAVPRLRGALIAVVAVDLLLALPNTILVGPTLRDLSSPLPRAIEPDAVVCIEPSLPAAAFASTGQELSAWNHYSYVRGMPYPELNACDGSTSAIPYSPLASRMSQVLERGLYRRRAAAARALGCGYLLARGPPPDGTVQRLQNEATWWRTYERMYDAAVYVIEDPLPAVLLARQPQMYGRRRGIADALSRTRDASGALAVVDDPLNNIDTPLPNGLGVTGAELDWPVRHRATVRVHGGGGAVIGLRSPFQVGWSARQGDRFLPTLRIAGHNIGAVVDDVARGPVVFRYTPPRLGLGLGLAVLGLGLLVVAARIRRVSGQPSTNRP